MKALSLTQPWASAVELKVKKWETRSWPTSFRGEFALHASKGFPGWAKDFAVEKGFAAEKPLLSLPLGAIIALCDLVECRQTETAVKEISEAEQAWGDYSEGRYCFRLENVRPLRAPVFCKGALGFWVVPQDVEQKVRSFV